MKKVWVLERFVTAEDLSNQVARCKDMLNTATAENDKERINLAIELLNFAEKMLNIYPDGYWEGLEGKIKYKQFCVVAKDCMRRHPKTDFRVVEGLIEDDADVWLGYSPCKINEGVLKYLRATK